MPSALQFVPSSSAPAGNVAWLAQESILSSLVRCALRKPVDAVTPKLEAAMMASFEVSTNKPFRESMKMDYEDLRRSFTSSRDAIEELLEQSSAAREIYPSIHAVVETGALVPGTAIQQWITRFSENP